MEIKKEYRQQNELLLRPLCRPLLNWYATHARSLPWRSDPTPYHVWLSEIMLQQTRVEAVKPYYERFLRELPDIAALAACPTERLMKLWEGLGYYSRARNLQKAAQLVTEAFDGQLPDSRDALLRLPGIGSYTAGAIASVAFGIRVPAVDGNVLRVISRVLGSDADIARPGTKKELEELLLAVMQGQPAGDFNQALMELGAVVCLPNGMPKCKECPLSAQCSACCEELTGVLPVKTPKKPRRAEKLTVFLLRCGKRVALRRRPEQGLLAGLWELPTAESTLTEQNALAWLGQLGLQAEQITALPPARHIFTHVEWHMTGFEVRCAAPEGKDLIWVTPQQAEREYSVPNAFARYKELWK